MSEEKIILPESPESAQLVTETFWKARNGSYYQEKDEEIARRAGATHKKCECGNITEKRYVKCESCRSKLDVERFSKLEKKKWII